MNNKTSNPLLHAVLPVAAVIIYVLLGFFFKSKGWAAGWLVFLLIPIVESCVTAYKTKNPSAFLYPVFVTAIFLAVGLIFHVWHPTWVLFVTIPAFYAICDSVNKSRMQKAFENAEKNPDNPTPPPFPQSPNAPQYAQYPPQYPQYPQNAYNPPKKSNALPIVLSIIFSVTAIVIAGIIALFAFLNNGLGTFISYAERDGYTEINISEDFKTDNIDSLEIDWVSGNIDIEYYDGETIYVEESGVNQKYPMCYKIEGGTLEISEFYKTNISGWNTPNKDLTVKIPTDFKAVEIDISVVSANVTAKGINTSELDFETVSGSGNFYFAVSPNKISTDSVSGDVMIALPQDVSGYSVSKETVSGSFDASDFDGELSFGDRSVSIDFDSVSGNFTVRKADVAQYKVSA